MYVSVRQTEYREDSESRMSGKMVLAGRDCRGEEVGTI